MIRRNAVSGLLLVFLLFHLRVFAAETIHATRGVNQLLTTRKIRVTIGADFDGDRLPGRPGRIRSATGAGDGHLSVIRMNARLHVTSSIS